MTEVALREGLKRGMTTDAFCEKYKMTPDQLKNFITETFLVTNYQKFLLSQLKRNDKRAKRTVSAQSNKAKRSAEHLISVTDEGDEGIDNTSSTTDIISELQAHADSLSSQICALEKTWQELISEDKEIRNRLRQHKASLVELRAEFERRQADVEDCILQLDNVSLSLSETNLQLSLLREDLNTTRNEISDLKKVIIYVYADGNIETENYAGELPSFDIDCSSILQQLSSDERFEELTIKAVKQYACLSALVKHLKENNMTFDISFDTENVRHLWEVLTK